jgi:hypothetical protein
VDGVHDLGGLQGFGPVLAKSGHVQLHNDQVIAKPPTDLPNIDQPN